MTFLQELALNRIQTLSQEAVKLLPYKNSNFISDINISTDIIDELKEKLHEQYDWIEALQNEDVDNQ